MSNSRLEKSIKNIVTSEGTYIIILIFSFINRSVFISELSSEHLGLNGLFSNILTILSLTELGVGSAINYSLYKPLNEKDIIKIRAIMALYKKIYNVIGTVVFFIGLSLVPFLDMIIKDIPENISHIRIYYLLYVFNSSCSYFYTYKKSLLICDQKEYIISLVSAFLNILLNIVQIIVLILTESYFIYLCLNIAYTFLENLIVSFIADKRYSFLKETERVKLDTTIVDNIKKNTFAMMLHKIGDVIVNATDNIIISKFIGLSMVGLYSNYIMVVNPINTLINKIFTSLTASIGNLMVDSDKGHVKEIFKRILFINVWIYGFCAICYLCLIQPFVRIWIGDNCLLSQSIVLMIVIKFYVSGVRKTVLIFRTASGLFWYDRHKPLIESVLNIILSVGFVIRFGVSGVLLGTIGSTLLLSFWYEGYILYKYYFGKGFWSYIWKQVLYAIQVAVIAGICSLVNNCLPEGGIIWFCFRLILISFLCFGFICAFSCKKNEFLYYVNILRKIAKDILKQKK